MFQYVFAGRGNPARTQDLYGNTRPGYPVCTQDLTEGSWLCHCRDPPLALGIGASTAIFSVLENILLEPFPYPDAQRFMSIQIHDTERNEPGGRGGFSGPEFLDYVAQNHVFDRVIGNDNLDVLYRSGEGTQRLRGNYVTPGTFEFLGMPALLGRVMQPADYEPGAPPVFVLRYKTWVKEFGADPNIMNQTFVLNGTSRTLIGIMPPRFGLGRRRCVDSR